MCNEASSLDEFCFWINWATNPRLIVYERVWTTLWNGNITIWSFIRFGATLSQSWCFSPNPPFFFIFPGLYVEIRCFSDVKVNFKEQTCRKKKYGMVIIFKLPMAEVLTLSWRADPYALLKIERYFFKGLLRKKDAYRINCNCGSNK